MGSTNRAPGWRRRGLPAWAAFAIALGVAPLLFDSSLALTLLSQTAIAIVACLSFNILLGQGGMLSFGHALQSGLGSFAAIHALQAIGRGSLTLPVSLVPLVGGAAGLLAAVLSGSIATRRSGTVFAMITLGLGELVFALATMLPAVFGGEAGVTANRVVSPPVWGINFGAAGQVYALLAVYAFICAAAMAAFTQTPLGRLLNAVRDNAERVGFIGVDARRVRFLAFLIAGFFAGVAGGMAALLLEIASAEMLSPARSGAYLLFTVLGGTGAFFGPVLGALLMVFATLLLASWTPAALLYTGLAFIAVVMIAPGGLASLPAAVGRGAASGGGRGLVLPGLLLLAGSTLLGAGVVALIEMTYQLQRGETLGPVRQVLGVGLDTSAVSTWIGVATLTVVGSCTSIGAWRLIVQRRAALQREQSASALGPVR